MNIEHTEDVMALRADAYPPLADLADALYWHSKGDPSKLGAYFAAVDAVKDRLPKIPPPLATLPGAAD